ncbi:hypothetical protein [Kribbella sp. NPDC004536]|uniref:hypothetical protein n=1 Tax=Kribbella sp. NPDC004536 TaxID=3364106 RepID=UPI00369EB6AF
MNDRLFDPRWRGRPGRLDISYATLTDQRTGTGLWFHRQLSAPTGAGHPTVHGFAGIFPPDGKPRVEHFGPVQWGAGLEWPMAMGKHSLSGTVNDISWSLTCHPQGPPLYTFPAWSWRGEILPATHMVPIPAGSFSGTVDVGGETLVLEDAHGAVGRIYGRGMGRKWAWLHANLGYGDALEVVAAVSNHGPFRRLPAMGFSRLRLAGKDWPTHGLLAAALRMRADIELPTWTVIGRIGNRRLTVTVQLPAEEVLQVPFRDPDGTEGVCHNSERADAEIKLESRRRGAWTTERRWSLQKTAHAEVGLRYEQE